MGPDRRPFSLRARVIEFTELTGLPLEMIPEEQTDKPFDAERLLRHRARQRILLGVHAAGQLSPAELARSAFGKGIPLEVYSYHFKVLRHVGVLKDTRVGLRGESTVARYEPSEHLTQSLLDAAALKAIADVLESIAEPLAAWIDKPFIEEIDQLVKAAGRLTRAEP